jgi:SAM-dependent methyltransferase
MTTARTAADLLELATNYWQTCSLHAGVDLDVFTAIGDGTVTAGALADQLGCDARALGMLLNALAAMGLLAKTGDDYRLAGPSGDSLDKRSPRYIGNAICHHHRLVPSWAKLPEAVRTGRSVRERTHMGGEDSGDREDFLMGMFDIAMSIAPTLTQALDLGGRKRLLDLGGGPGTYAVHFCLANPDLTASVYDLAPSRTFAASVAARFGVADRVDFVAGNYLEDPVPGGYDVAWLSHILHAESPEGCRTIIGQAVKALKPGGLFFIHEFMLDDTMDGPQFATLFSLNMLLGTPHGQAYSVGQLREMLLAAGVGEVTLLDFIGPNDSRLLRGVVA